MNNLPEDRLARRRRAFVEASMSLFVEQGFERTTLTDVVERAGGSLATLYKLFGNKAGLLAAAFQEEMRSSESLLAEIGESGQDPATALHNFGDELGKRLLDPQRVAMSRIVIAYSLQDAAFAADFYRDTLLHAQQTLTELFEGWRSQGVPLKGQPDELAEVFLGLFVYTVHCEAISHGAMSRRGAVDFRDKIDFFCRGAGLCQ